ncbi:MAG TPA: hypothetical protein DER07_07795 [Armatimonadetes bacterium]|nr:hypothetical protein [Armatimonadota bacterium]
MRLSDEQARAAREAAWRLLDRFYVSRPQDIRERGVAYKLDVLVTDGPILTADAWLVCSEKKGLVRVRSSIPWEGQRRFCVAHELGHWVLHRGKVPYWICTEEQMRNSGNDLMERQANVFAGEFLMPEEIFRPHAEACEPSIANIIRLAETFRTSLSSTALNFLRLCARDAAVICTQNGKIHWDSRPAGCTLPQAKQGYPVGPEAALHSARFDPPVSAEKAVGPVEVPGSAWYPNWNGSLLEESIVLLENRVALSVLKPL